MTGFSGLLQPAGKSKAILRTALLLVLGAGLHIAPAQADIDYDSRRSAALRRCDEPRHHGKVEEARACYQPLLRDANALVRAEAAFALGDIRGANDLFRAAVAADPRSVLPRLRWGRLYMEVGNNAEAQKLFTEALDIDANDVEVKLALANLGLREVDAESGDTTEKLVEKNADHVEAQLLAASLALENGKVDEATRAAERALQLTQQQKLPPLEAHSMLAVIELVRHRDPAQWTRAALAYNPRYGSIFEDLAHYELSQRLYVEADVWLQQAVKVQPDLWSARREYALNLMRLGRVSEARPHLEASYEGDPFSATTVNTLRLLDDLSKFEVIKV